LDWQECFGTTKWTDVQKAMGDVPNQMVKAYPDDDLLGKFAQLASETNELPTMRHWTAPFTAG
jgi:hypothetical protein